jgi:phosphosulfolactate phosphohydrolase-like enzyme
MDALDLSRGSGAMRIQRRRPSELTSQRADAIVVIDVIRMTSTAAVLMSRPACTRVTVAATLEDLERLPRPPGRPGDFLVVSELPGAARMGPWIDNSPAQASRVSLGDRTPVLVTTNGTRTLLAAAACGDRVFLASFVDLHAVARHIADLSVASVVLLPAGHFASGEGRVEDDLCADALAALLAGREPDLAASAAAIRADPRVRRRADTEPGFSADLDLALRGDAGAGVLEFFPLDAGVGHIVRASQDRSRRT